MRRGAAKALGLALLTARRRLRRQLVMCDIKIAASMECWLCIRPCAKTCALFHGILMMIQQSGLPLQRFTGKDLGPEVKPLATRRRGSEWYRQDCSSGLSDQRRAPICSPTLPPAFPGMEPVAFERKDLGIWAGALRRMCA